MAHNYASVFLTALGYELGPQIVTSSELEARLEPVYQSLNLQPGQLEAWTGIVERRWWEQGTRLSTHATAAARKALAKTSIKAADLGIVIYAGVCRENFEPATACAVADALGVRGAVSVYDLSNACLGVLNAMIDIANRIELGQIRAGLVVSCETAREINEQAIARLVRDIGAEAGAALPPGSGMDKFAEALATFTGGSGAVAMLLTDGSFQGTRGHRVRGAVSQVAPEHHRLCRWGLEPTEIPDFGHGYAHYMATDSVAVMKHGVDLGLQTWQLFLKQMGWTPAQVDRVICHQVGSGHQDAILKALNLPRAKDYTTYRFLGNMGTAALPVTAAIAEERGVLQAGQSVGFLGIGSGLTCLMMGLEW
ncbi:MAG: 3-oxoacyl-ACP synthase III [Betaproteobacteria bacterium RIFCSPLOWO2_02_FULL_63_19]|nr:MAG: 3-oxoacyl-ACP synthase III [Betaproteobacteria bacterium RIFCSPLOWO2_02_FULL_63_19]